MAPSSALRSRALRILRAVPFGDVVHYALNGRQQKRPAKVKLTISGAVNDCLRRQLAVRAGSCMMLLACTLLVAAAAALADEIRPSPPDFRPMYRLLGSWRCIGHGEGNVAHSSTTTYGLALSRRWLRVHTTSSPYPSRSWFLEAVGYVTYDRERKVWLAMYFANEGGYSVLHSNGWRGDEIVWHAGPPPGFDDYREILQLTSSTRYRMTIRQRDKSNILRIIGTGICRRE